MRRMTLLFGTVSLLCVGTIGAIAACGDDDATAVDPGAADAAASADTAATSSSGASTSGTTGTSSSGGATDGGTDANGSTSGDTASNPGKVTCAAALCDAGGGPNPPVCCQAKDIATSTCTRAQQCDNSGGNANLAMRCDEKADCNGNQVCCYVRQNNDFEAECRMPNECRTFGGGPGAGTPRPRLCKTTAECGDAGACAEKTCDGFKLRVCGTPQGCE